MCKFEKGEPSTANYLELNTYEKRYLDLFKRATVNKDQAALKELTATSYKYYKVRKSLFKQHNSKDRDIYEHKDFQQLCGRCLYSRRQCVCFIDSRDFLFDSEDWRLDYIMNNNIEEVLADYFDKVSIAYDFQPYGNGTLGLPINTIVRIALPYHNLKDMLGKIIAYREMDGRYLVDVFVGKDITKIYCRPNELIVSKRKLSNVKSK